MRLRLGDVRLEDRRFRRVLGAEAVSTLGSRVAPVALVFAVLDISDAAGVGLVLAARSVVQVALLLGGGVVADRSSPRTLMMAADVVRGASQGLTAALLVTVSAQLWHVIALQAPLRRGRGVLGPRPHRADRRCRRARSAAGRELGARVRGVRGGDRRGPRWPACSWWPSGRAGA